MKNSIEHLKSLYRTSTSENLLKRNPVGFKVSVNNYIYYKNKYKILHKDFPNIEEKLLIERKWKCVLKDKHYNGKNFIKGLSKKKRFIWMNTTFTTKK